MKRENTIPYIGSFKTIVHQDVGCFEYYHDGFGGVSTWGYLTYGYICNPCGLWIPFEGSRVCKITVRRHIAIHHRWLWPGPSSGSPFTLSVSGHVNIVIVFILLCPAYAEIRKQLFKEIRTYNLTILSMNHIDRFRYLLKYYYTIQNLS